MFKSNSVSSNTGEIFEIEQCLFPIPEEFFLKGDSISEEECISISISESLKIPNLPPYTSRESILDHAKLPQILDKLCFNEMLLISTDNDEIVGGFAIHVETIADEVIAVFCSSHFSIDKNEKIARSELLALADKQLNPYQERKCETILTGDIKQEKQLQLYFDENQNITAFRHETIANEAESFQGVLTAGEEGFLLPDGLNIIYMRYLMLINFTGDIHTRTIDIQGCIGHSIYQITPCIPTKINGEIHDTKQVIRTVYYADTDEPEISVSYYLTTGHLLRHTWNNSSYSIIINPKLSISNLPLDMNDLHNSMQTYLKELSKLLEVSPSEKSRCYSLLKKPTEIVRAVLSEIIAEATQNTATRRLSIRRQQSSDAIRNLLEDIIDKISIL
ncbi:uncharacterized protein LOC128740212 [Sabethes cyaneus]|uniref:uncharacterized protein LOC128740212 n=1 Tax=Sabethes cyaneus TaxID=53552 RepID=UPI00237D75E0|nr:uncharacterized protein LOC128740212 [Sabethes cyaneus]